MFNGNHQRMYDSSPRISFSNGFVDPEGRIRREQICRDAQHSSDFEFSVGNHSMIAADELFFKGRMIPMKGGYSNKSQKTTLRDELQQDDDSGEDSSSRPPKGSMRWKSLLGRKKSQISSKKNDKSDASSSERIIDAGISDGGQW